MYTVLKSKSSKQIFRSLLSQTERGRCGQVMGDKKKPSLLAVLLVVLNKKGRSSPIQFLTPLSRANNSPYCSSK